MAKTSLVAALDAGSSATRCLIGLLEKDQLRLIGASCSPAQGWVKGRLTDLESIVDSFRQAVAEVEASAGVTLPPVVLGFGGPTIEGASFSASFDLGSLRVIEPADTSYVLSRVLDSPLPPGRMILQAFPQGFWVDGESFYWNPHGISGSSLEASMHLVLASAREHDDVVRAAQQAGLAVEETVFEAVAAALAALTAEERRSGVAVIDIGAHSSELAFIYGDTLLASSTIPIGGEHFTRDAAHKLCVSTEEAERLKIDFGSAAPCQQNPSTLVAVPAACGEERELLLSDLNEALEARAWDLFDRVRRHVDKAATPPDMPEQVILVGGGALLNGIWKTAENCLRRPARVGLVDCVQNWPSSMRSPEWTTPAGLLLYAARLRWLDSKPKRPGFLERWFGGGWPAPPPSHPSNQS